jgi:hypothetical protein
MPESKSTPVVCISTFTMISHSGKRSEAGEAMMRALREREWGLLLLDEVHVVPAAMFRKVGGARPIGSLLCTEQQAAARAGAAVSTAGELRAAPAAAPGAQLLRRGGVLLSFAGTRPPSPALPSLTPPPLTQPLPTPSPPYPPHPHSPHPVLTHPP